MTGHRRSHGEGSIAPRGPDKWRLRYRIGNRRYSVTVDGTKAAAQRELRRLLRDGDTGEHVAPDKRTLAQWTGEWLALISRSVTARTRERYGELLASYVLPALGSHRLQALTVTDIDRLYSDLERRVSAATVRHVHVALKAMLAVAADKGHVKANAATKASVPRAVEPEVGQALDASELRRLLDGFRGSTLFPIVVTAALTGARLGEVLALQWSDLDATAKTLRIERAIEVTAAGRRLKAPKTKRGTRTIAISDTLLAMMLAERDKYLRLIAGVGIEADVDLSLVRLPVDALMFPSPAGDGFDLARLRNPKSVTKETRARFRSLGFAALRFHDLRGSHGTALLDAGVPVHVVAARLGHDPAMLLRSYARRNSRSDEAAAAIIGELARGVL